MSDILAKAIWNAKVGRRTPYVINVVDQADERLVAANRRITELERLNTELKGRLGGLMTSMNQKMESLRDGKLPIEIPKFLKLSQIADAVGNEFRISVIDMQSERRTKDATVPRQVAMYLSRKMSNRSYPTIGKFFGDRDHTTVMHAFKKIEKRRIEDLVLDSRIEQLEQFLLSIGDKISDDNSTEQD